MNTPSEEIVLKICSSFPKCIWDYCGQSSKRAVMMKFKEALDTTRREALEEAAKIAENFKYLSDCNCDRNVRIAEEIRERININWKSSNSHKEL